MADKTLLISQIQRFLQSEVAEVLCISGEWGVGKTHTWNSELTSAACQNKVKLSRYSYVSLFGRNSIDDVQMAIAERSRFVKDLCSSRQPLTLREIPGRSFNWVFGRGGNFAKLTTETEKFGNSANRVHFAQMRKQIVCFDDLERAGRQLEIRDLMGLTTYLVTEKHCKVAIILNQDALTGNNAEDFLLQIEKVADRLIRFDPNPKDSAITAILTPPTVVGAPAPQNASLIRRHSEKLGIINIRVIQAAARYSSEVCEILGPIDDRITEAIVKTVVLASFAKSCPQIAPPLEFIRNYNRIADIVASQMSKQPDSPEVAKYKNTLGDYGFTYLTGLDTELLDTVDRGYCDPSRLKLCAATIDEDLRHSDAVEAIRGAWAPFNDSFDDNQDEALDAIYNGTHQQAKFVGGEALVSALKILTDFGREQQVDEILNKFLKCNHRPVFWRTWKDKLASFTKSPNLLSRIEEISLAPTAPMSASEILMRIYDTHGWDVADEAFLNSMAVADFVSLFRDSRGDDRDKIIREAVNFQSGQSSPGKTETIANKARAALKEIAGQSKMNALRVSRLIDLRHP